MIGTLEDVKRKLDLPASDTSLDEALRLPLAAATSWVLDKCGYLEEETQLVELHRGVEAGTPVVLRKRPVKVAASVPVAAVATRLSVAGDWETLDADAWEIIDTQAGLLELAHAAAAGWPFYREPPPLDWRRAGQVPHLQLTYTVTGIGSGVDAPEQLRDATAALAAWLYDRHQAGAATSMSLGALHKDISTEGLPSWIAANLREHDRDGTGRSWLV